MASTGLESGNIGPAFVARQLTHSFALLTNMKALLRLYSLNAICGTDIKICRNFGNYHPAGMHYHDVCSICINTTKADLCITSLIGTTLRGDLTF